VDSYPSNVRHWLSGVLTSLVLAAMPFAASARIALATPPQDGVAGSVVIGGLANPRDFAWGPDGLLYVALAGAGASQETPIATTEAGLVPGKTASIVRVENGCLMTIIGGWPAGELSSLGWSFLEMDLASLDRQLYVLETAGGPVHGTMYYAALIYRLDSDQILRLVANLETWVNTPTAPAPASEAFPDGRSLFAMTAGNDALWVSDNVNGQVLRITPAGDVTRFADLWTGESVPTGLAPAPDGGAYIGFVSTAPLTDESSKVSHITADGRIDDVWTGLTALVGITVGPDGSLFAAEMSTGNDDQALSPTSGTGKIVKQTGPATHTDVVIGLDAPAAVHFGSDGGLFVSGPAFGANATAGMILRLDINSGVSIAPTGQPSRPVESCAETPTP
jgi:hypothetical protein